MSQFSNHSPEQCNPNECGADARRTYCDLLPPTKSDPKGQSGFDFTPFTDGGPIAGDLTIKNRRVYVTYTVTEFPSGWDGRGFYLSKQTTGSDPTEEAYSCFIARNGEDKQCECKGFAHTGGCKHLATLAALIANGWL
jgi:hypothetical protein